jgi:hypothetical protein
VSKHFPNATNSYSHGVILLERRLRLTSMETSASSGRTKRLFHRKYRFSSINAIEHVFNVAISYLALSTPSFELTPRVCHMKYMLDRVNRHDLSVRGVSFHIKHPSNANGVVSSVTRCKLVLCTRNSFTPTIDGSTAKIVSPLPLQLVNTVCYIDDFIYCS